MAVGISVIVDDDLIKKMETADGLIKKLADDSEATRDRMIAAFKSMGDNGVQYLINKLKDAQTSLNDLSAKEIKIKTTGLDEVSTQATQAVDNVNNLLQVMQKVSETKQVGGVSVMNIAELKESIRNISEAINDTENLLDKNTQQYLVNARDALKQELKLQEESTRQKTEKAEKETQKRIELNIRETAEFEKMTTSEQQTYLKMLDKMAQERMAYQERMTQVTNTKNKIESNIEASVNEEIKKENEAYMRMLETQTKAEQEYQARMSELKARRAKVEADAQKAVDEEIKRENDAYQKELEKRIKAEQEYQARMTQIRMAQQQRQRETYSGALSYSSQATTLTEEKQAIDYLNQAKQNLIKTDSDYSKKLNELNTAIRKHQENIKRAGMTDSEYADMVKKNAEQRRNAAIRETEAYERRKKVVMDKWYSSSPDRALNFSSTTKSINEQTQAIKYLQAARDNLSKRNMTDEQYKKKVQQLTDEIKRQQGEITKLIGKNSQLAKTHSKLMDVSGQLARKLALVFSVSQIQGYISNLVKVRGEFELQQKSLQVLLQNRDEANKLWQQTVELAVKSPFRVGELVSYTRQLAAYRIETSKLHETTRKLADVSAGLGVDMNRLILAYGQVRAAEYLRGTELRQFTEAGIPMLDELAKRFTELEGRVVSAGDVFERISKRMVTFGDVAAVFDKMTSAGGTFYKMQEEQSTTLKGMISNLRDTVDLMMNDIGQYYDGILKGGVNIARILVEHWQILANTMKTIIGIFALYRIATFAASEKTLELAASLNMASAAGKKHLNILQLMSLGFKTLGKEINKVYTVIMANPWLAIGTIALAVITKATMSLIEHSKQLDEINKKYQKLSNTANEITYRFQLAVDEKDYAEQRKRLQSLIDLANNEYHLNIKIDVQGLKEEEISAKFTALRQQLMEANAFAKEFEMQMVASTKWRLENDIFEDLKQLGDKSENLKNILTRNLSSVVVKLRENYDQLSEKQKDAYERLRKPIGENETELQYVERIKGAYSDLISEYTDLQEKVNNTTNRKELYDLLEQSKKLDKNLLSLGLNAQTLSAIFKGYAPSLEEAKREYQRFIDKNKEFFDTIRNLPEDKQTFFLQIAIDKVGAEKNWGEFEQEYIKRWTEDEFELHFRVVPPEEKPLEEWQKKYNEKFKDYEGFQILNADSTREKVLQRINGLLSTQKKLVDAITKAGTKDSAYVGMSLENEQKKLRQLEAQRDFFGGDTKNGEKGKDWYSELANNIKAAHKEFVSLNKDLSTTEAASLMIKRYTGVIHESLAAIQKEIPNFDISQYDLTNEDSTIEALSQLFGMLPESAKTAKLNVQKALSDLVGEQTINKAKDQTTQLINGIKDMIDGYKLSIELERLDIPQNLAEDLFDVKTFNLDDIKARIAAEKAADKEISKERLKQLEQLERQVADLEDKARMEKLKKYTKYLLQAQSETVKIKLDEVKQIAEIESLNMTPDQKAIAKQAVREETQKKLDKQQWEDFKNTDMYIELFEELDNVSTKTLENMKAKLVEMRKSLNNLDPSQLKDITKRIDDVNKELVTRNPFKNIAQSIKGVISGYKKYQETAEAAMTSQVEVDRQQSIVDGLAVQVELQKKKLDTNQKGEKLTWEEYTAGLSNHALLTGNLKIATDKLNTLKKINKERQKENKEAKETFVLSKETLQATASELSEQLSAINDIKDAWSGVFGGMSASLSDAFDSMQEIGGGVINIMEGMAKGPAGYLQAAAGLMQTIGGIFNIGDKKKERQIQREIDKVEDLQHAYEKLEKAINDAYAIDTLELTTKNAKANLQKQIDSYNSMIAAEEAKKKTDKDRIKEWQYAIEDLQEQIKELDKQAFSKATNGIIDDVLSAANEFTDAWLSAFNEVGNGLSGLKDNFQEMMLNMVKQQASMLITQQYVNNWKKELERYISADDLELTTDEAKQWVASVTNSLPQLNDALTAYFEAMKAAGIDLTSGDSNLSGLARGIQGITEEQADILAAYWNSCRFFLSNIDMTLTNLANHVMGTANVESPMVTQLKIIAQQTSAINTLLQSVSRGGHTMGGTGLKVFIN